MIKLVAIDIDGTLLNDKHEITPEVHAAIHKAKAQGVKIVLCTGRPITGVQQYLSDLELKREGDYVITFNGAMVQDTFTKEVISHLTLDHANIMDIYAMSRELGLHMHFNDMANLYTPNRDIGKYTVYESYLTNTPLFYTPMDEVAEDIMVSKAMFIDEEEILAPAIAKIPASFGEKYNLVRSSPFFLEVLNPEASKGNAVHGLAQKLGIKQSEVMCIGDQENDSTMIEYAGVGVAMENAIDKIKAMADFITLSNEESGVAHAINKFVLEG
ncbi:sugar-phosphatase [Listeria newyorkensis]|uniref:Sugar-phosphatase n=1 Tax=Listeria newyorkensis TaxID=1497681 RepID=A0A841YVS2_9LIST|nr:sugar-phosphatase [Listeria newyorkensis]MBC1457911.1 sugar-phosphatase [Listeria newyorkensis]